MARKFPLLEVAWATVTRAGDAPERCLFQTDFPPELRTSPVQRRLNWTTLRPPCAGGARFPPWEHDPGWECCLPVSRMGPLPLTPKACPPSFQEDACCSVGFLA